MGEAEQKVNVNDIEERKIIAAGYHYLAMYMPPPTPSTTLEEISTDPEYEEFWQAVQKSRSLYQSLLEAVPNDSTFLAKIGMTYSKVFDYWTAIFYFLRSAASDPDYYSPHSLIISHLERIGVMDGEMGVCNLLEPQYLFHAKQKYL